MNRPCVNKECTHYKKDYQDGTNCKFFEPKDRDYLCKKYIPEPEPLPKYVRVDKCSGICCWYKSEIGKVFKVVASDVTLWKVEDEKGYEGFVSIADCTPVDSMHVPKLAEPQEIAFEIEFYGTQSPLKFDILGQIPANYFFKCFEFSLPDGENDYKNYSIGYLIQSGTAKSEDGVCYYVSDTCEAGSKTIRASRVIFAREGE